MKAIENIGCLEEKLSAENPLWQRIVFEKTGVIVLPKGQEQHNWILVSACGYADLGDDIDSGNGFCTVEAINDLITYIESMDAYNCALKNIKIYNYYKADLFWAIYKRILSVNSYRETEQFDYPDGNQVFGMRAIWGLKGSDWHGTRDGDLWFDMSACGVDTLSGIEVEEADIRSMNGVVDLVADQLEFYDDLLEEAKLKYHKNEEYPVPVTYEEVLSGYRNIRY